MSFGRVVSQTLPVTLLTLLLVNCSGSPSDSVVLTADKPLHLEDHLDAATIVGSEVPANVPSAMEWGFDEPQEDWKPVVPWNPTNDPVEVTQLDDGLRLTFTDGTRNPNGNPRGGLVLEVPDWNYEDLAHLVVRARTSDEVSFFFIGFNRSEGTGTDTSGPNPFEHDGDLVLKISPSEPFAEAGVDGGPASPRQLERRPRYFSETPVTEAAATIKDCIDRIEQ